MQRVAAFDVDSSDVVEEKSCFTRFKSNVNHRWHRWTDHFWSSNLSAENSLEDQNRGGYVVEWINTLLPIADMITTVADATGFSSLLSASYAFAKEPSLGLTWGGMVAATPCAAWLAHVDVQCHAAQSEFITKKSALPTEEKTVSPVESSGKDVESGNKAPFLARHAFFADKPNDFLVEGIQKKGHDIFVTRSQFRLAQWHFFKDTIEKINPPLIGIKILYGVVRLIPYLDVAKHLEDNTSEAVYTTLTAAAKISLFLVLYHFASRASRLQFENTIEAFEDINRTQRQLVARSNP